MGASDTAAANVAEAEGPPILRLRPQDADGVCPLSIEAGWNQVAADWRLMISAGSAFGIQDAAGRWTASALALPLGSQVSWISMVLVTQAERRQGHGTRLLRRCIAEGCAMGSAPAFAGAQGLTPVSGRAMGLDATEFGRPVYLPLGFRDLYTISRWSVSNAAEASIAPPAGIAMRTARPQDVEQIAKYDRRCSGFERRAILDNLLARAPHLALVAERGDGSLAGFSLGRDGHGASHVGPVMAEDQAVGLALVSAAVAGIRGAAIVDVPDGQEHIRRWLQSRGALAPRSFMRMLRGAAPAVEDASRIMAIAGPELA